VFKISEKIPSQVHNEIYPRQECSNPCRAPFTDAHHVASESRMNQNTRGYHLYPHADVVHVKQVLPFLQNTRAALHSNT